MRSIIVLPLQHVFHLISLLSLCIFSVSSAFGSPALPGCDDMCGNVTIPYPFGIGTGCHMNEWFSVTCDTSFYPSKPFLSYHKAEVVEILLNGTLRISSKMSSDCIFREYGSMNLGDNPYFLYSERGNRFTALGCGVQASISENNELIGGCISICNNESRSSITRNGDGCYGIDCCQAMIPYGLKNFTLEVRGTRRDGVYETCKFAFLADKDWIFSQSFPYPFSGIPPEVPVVIDWKFSAQETCGICGPNTVCKTDNQGFNSCLCDAGFEGNPYLPHGCSDVDECADPLLNRCVKNCINKPGNYSCSCPSGYHGDGQKDGSGCILNKSWVKPTLIGTSAGLGVLFIIFGALWSYKVLQRRKIIKLKEKFFKRNGGLLLQQKLSSNEGSVEKTKLFTSTELEIATDRYNENRILGRGGQGTVYKGMLTDGRIVAVKMSTVIDEGQIEQFINEVVILSQIDHRNVVKLLGCCLETEVPLLVYEFIPNGTLSHVIEDQTEEFPMSWEMRLRVAAEVASAIAYLHSAASVLIYHRDIKSSNILLDEKFRAKLSDFGTSKSVALDQTHLTTQVKGTFGYLDPEYFRSSQFTEKSDVYSFGVVLVELLTGLKPICSVGTQEKISLVAYFISSLEENRLFDILDARVVKEDLKEELMAVAYLAKRCLDLNGRNRPSMKEVAMELEGIMISKGYLFTQQKQVEVQVKESTKIIKLSSNSSAGTYSDIKSPSTLDVQQLMFYTL